MAKNSVKKVLLRLPEPLWKNMKKTAKKENRSMHGQILEILQEYSTMKATITEATRTGSYQHSVTILEPKQQGATLTLAGS